MADQRDDPEIAAWLEHCAKAWRALLHGTMARDAKAAREELDALVASVAHG